MHTRANTSVQREMLVQIHVLVQRHTCANTFLQSHAWAKASSCANSHTCASRCLCEHICAMMHACANACSCANSHACAKNNACVSTFMQRFTLVQAHTSVQTQALVQTLIVPAGSPAGLWPVPCAAIFPDATGRQHFALMVPEKLPRLAAPFFGVSGQSRFGGVFPSALSYCCHIVPAWRALGRHCAFQPLTDPNAIAHSLCLKVMQTV